MAESHSTRAGVVHRAPRDAPPILGRRSDAEKTSFAKELRRKLTPAEAALWQRLRGGRAAGFHFRRQQIVDGFILDFYCHAALLAVELDGGIHADQPDYDAERSRVLEQRNVAVRRFTNDEVLKQTEQVVALIVSAAIDRSEALGSRILVRTIRPSR